MWGAISSNSGLFAGEISHLLCNDIEGRRGDPDQALRWHKLSEPRQQVAHQYVLNRGVAGVLAFKRMLAAASGGHNLLSPNPPSGKTAHASDFSPCLITFACMFLGGSYFFTVALLERRCRLLTEHIEALREAFGSVRDRRPFRIDAIVILPDHLRYSLQSGQAWLGAPGPRIGLCPPEWAAPAASREWDLK